MYLEIVFPGGQVSWQCEGLVPGAWAGVTLRAPVYRRLRGRELRRVGQCPQEVQARWDLSRLVPHPGSFIAHGFPGQNTFSFVLQGLTTSMKRGFGGKLFPRLGLSLSPFHIRMFGSQLCEICVVSPQRNL